MMNDILIKVSKETRYVYLNKTFLSNDGENLQDNLVFKFEDEFVDGIGRLEYDLKGDKNFITMEKGEDYYSLPVKSVLTKEGTLCLQLVITESQVGDSTPIFKSNRFFLTIGASINATEEAPEGYEQWIDIANEKLAEMDNLNIEANKTGTVTTVTITDKSGNESSVEINDGQDGSQGEQGPQGLPGEKGDPGATGPANTLSIGTVTKGTDANATITGTAPNQTLNLVLPKGDKGDKGDTGATPDMSNYYTKTEVDNKVANVKPFFLGTVTDFTQQNPLDLDNLDTGIYAIRYDVGNFYISVTINDVKKINMVILPKDLSINPVENEMIYLDLRKKPDDVQNNSIFGYITYLEYEQSTYAEQIFRSVQLKKVDGDIHSGTASKYEFKISLLNQAQTITKKKTFNVLPESSVIPTTNNQLVNKKYVDDTVGDISTILESLVTVSQGGN